jgi:ferredoxin
MKVQVNPELCSGSGICIETCPEMFKLDEQGKTTAKNEQVSSEFEQACRNAAEGCPTGAIKIEE